MAITTGKNSTKNKKPLSKGQKTHVRRLKQAARNDPSTPVKSNS